MSGRPRYRRGIQKGTVVPLPVSLTVFLVSDCTKILQNSKTAGTKGFFFLLFYHKTEEKSIGKREKETNNTKKCKKVLTFLTYLRLIMYERWRMPTYQQGNRFWFLFDYYLPLSLFLFRSQFLLTAATFFCPQWKNVRKMRENGRWLRKLLPFCIIDFGFWPLRRVTDFHRIRTWR